MINGLNERLQTLRKQYKLSQKDVAKALGVSPSIISGYETGERNPSLENLLALSYMYRCSTDFLLKIFNTIAFVRTNITSKFSKIFFHIRNLIMVRDTWHLHYLF